MSDDLVKIVIELGEDGWLGHETEGVWAERISDDLYCILNSTWFAKGISFEDVVVTSEREEKLFYEHISAKSGNSTYRIMLPDEDCESRFEEYWRPLEAIGCTYEGMSLGKRQLLSVNAPKSTEINTAYRLLKAGEDSGVWVFEEGDCGHLASENANW
ncbi:DUF4265 domain-containing protein [Hoeflea sp. WL0058]|uniref:DUF4265 domain-containing protein n=1 Tax=Flavimaribacter sediminis TaxID=2865987 RepID=A0AAE3CZW1_9HYPH|nr:DUF4265 domain-containing protein [Flavimaribacter sediminis]